MCSTEQRLGGERGRPQPLGGSAATPSPRPFVLRPSPALPPGCPPARRPPSRRLPPLPSLSAQPCPAPRCLPPPGRTEGRTGCPAPARSLPPPAVSTGRGNGRFHPARGGRLPPERGGGGRCQGLRPLGGSRALTAKAQRRHPQPAPAPWHGFGHASLRLAPGGRLAFLPWPPQPRGSEYKGLVEGSAGKKMKS